MAIEFNPMRSMIFTDLAKEEYRHKLLKWQNSIPDDDDLQDGDNMDGDEFRSSSGKKGGRPFVFAFHPLSWEEDLKGKERTLEDGANYRFIFMIRWPEGKEDEGEKWLHEKVFPVFAAKPEVTRILSSRILQEVNNCPYHRVTEVFPYLTKDFNFTSIFITDIPYSDNLTQYRGYIAKR